MENINEIIGDNLSALRKQKGLTQYQLAEKFNYTDKSISKWEKGDSLPSIETLKQLADFYDVTLDYLTEIKHENTKVNKQQVIVPRSNKLIISLLAISVIWILATIIYVNAQILLKQNAWLTFVCAVPVSFVLAIIFNGIWGSRKMTYFYVSALIWTSLVTAYLFFLQYNLWIIFILGIPMQISVILWSGIKPKKQNKEPKTDSKQIDSNQNK